MTRLTVLLALWCGVAAVTASGAVLEERRASLLDDGVLITWYGNPHTGAMGVLGQASGEERASALRRQVSDYQAVTERRVRGAYHLVAAVAQPHAGADGAWRRRESPAVIRDLLDEAREYGFELVLDIQPGRASVVDEVRHLRPFLEEPDVHLALDPEFAMNSGQVPGQQIGQLPAADVNAALDVLEEIIREHELPKKVLILYQFTLGMLPDKENIRESALVDVVLCMDGIGSRALKLDSYRAVMRQGRLPFAGLKIFYEQDTNLFTPADVLDLAPQPLLVSYQ